MNVADRFGLALLLITHVTKRAHFPDSRLPLLGGSTLSKRLDFQAGITVFHSYHTLLWVASCFVLLKRKFTLMVVCTSAGTPFTKYGL